VVHIATGNFSCQVACASKLMACTYLSPATVKLKLLEH